MGTLNVKMSTKLTDKTDTLARLTLVRNYFFFFFGVLILCLSRILCCCYTEFSSSYSFFLAYLFVFLSSSLFLSLELPKLGSFSS